WRDVGVVRPPGIEDHEVRSGIEPRSNTLLVFAGDADWSRGGALALNVAGDVLGIRLRERVREQLGGTYSISTHTRSSALPAPNYLAYVFFGSDPERVEELFGEVMDEVAWLRGGGEQKYLDTVKEQLRTARQEDLRRNGFWLTQIRTAAQRGEPFAEMVGFEDRLDALTLEDVAAAAELYFTPERYVRVVLFPVE
ncbi:MAG: insulinase family protein, partial [Chloroflexota bacterium]|nr:insulinase family protein [Chloroflexota bacterium]